jgi:hypothetical protein
MTPTERLLRAHLRWRKAVWPLVVLVIGLAASLFVAWLWHSGRAPSSHWWTGGLVFTALAAVVVWAARRQGLERSARELDARLAAKNRLEAAHELAASDHALARSQREETAVFLAGRRIRSHRGALFLLTIAAVLLALAQPATWLAWTQPWRHVSASAKAAPSPTPPPNLASIRWKSPDAEIQATAVEEVPLAARAESSHGLRDLTLEVSLNGEPKLSAPVAVEKLDTAGPREIEASIYLDQIEAQPYDIVSYYLRARRVGADDLPETTSPVQFVQVKPFRDDVMEGPGGDVMGTFPLIKALKAAQLRLLKENFLLAHADLARSDATWKSENARVGREQEVLGKKTQDVIDRMISEGAPAEVVNLLAQAKPPMADAAQKIANAANESALAPQGKALGLITELEKFVVKSMAKDGRQLNNPPNVADPFERQRQLELKQRFETQAGELELLAAEQRRLAEDLARSDATPTPTPRPDGKPERNRIDGTPTERQTKISQRVGALVNGQVFVPEVLAHLGKARDFARDSLRQLDAGDTPAAREPAAAAASELRLAADAMSRAGDEQAKEALVKALQKLSEAAAEARHAPEENTEAAARERAEAAARQANEMARELAAAAQRQQESGSAQAAKKLDELAKALAGDDLKKALDALEMQPRDAARANEAASRLQALADRAGREKQRGPLTEEQIAQLVQQMERMRANLERLAESRSPGAPQEGREKERGQNGKGSKPGPAQQGNAAGNQPGKGEGPQPAPGQGDQKGQGESPGDGKSPGQGKGSGEGKQGSSEQMANASSEGQSSGSSEGEGRAKGDGRQGPGENGRSAELGAPDDEEVTRALTHEAPHAAGSGNGVATSRTTTLAPRPLSPEAREHMTRELVGDLRAALADANAVAPEAANRVQTALENVDTARHLIDPSTLLVTVEPSLEGLIEQLRAQAGHAARGFDLTDQALDTAPAAYRDAVADYFERLSREAADAAHQKKP